MDGERWTKVDRLFDAALEREPHERGAFLREACAGDEALRKEVETLLAHEEGGGDFLEGHALGLVGGIPPQRRGPSLAGQQLGPYRVLSLIGAGGMGEVYRAHDEKLARDVALKVLRSDLIADADRKRRFVTEARAASALNHPNIVTIHDIEQEDGVDFIVMELVSGQALDRVIPDRGLPVGRALHCAEQIASAIEAAHRAGIVHRDIKPANVMVSEDGLTKVLDFGLAKLLDRAVEPGAKQATAETATQVGAVLGTPAYMSPEQAQGLRVDGRSDVFSFGAVLYEMLAGRRPFGGDTPLATLASVMGQTPAPLKSVRSDLPLDLERLVAECLDKDPAARPAARDVVRRLMLIRQRQASPSVDWRGLVRRPVFAVSFVAVLVGVAAASWWWWSAAARARWARTVAVPEIQRLADESDYDGAFRLAREAMAVLPDDPQLTQLWLNVTVPAAFIRTEPPGADVSIKGFPAAGSSWYALGRTPLENVRVPADLVRLRIFKQGFESLDISEGSVAVFARGVSYRLDEDDKVPPGMVRAMGGRTQFANVVADVSDYWIDRLEVTNRQFKEFVDAGGYRKREHWREPFILDGRTLTWEEATARFLDATGRPGPATWELGTFPEGQADFPVTGVSWYEAAAYAEFAGKSLPTGFHWNRAAGFRPVGDLSAVSNFDGKGLAQAGSYLGLGPFGTYDMAGNVKEWARNQIGGRRAILGGAWNEPNFMFWNVDAVSPFDRQPNFGFRCVRYIEQPAAALTAPIPNDSSIVPDLGKPVGDDIFEVYRALYRYDPRPLNASVERTDDTPLWRKEKVTFDAAYGSERVPVYLFLPKHVPPPFQVVVAFPPFEAFALRSSRELGLRWADFIVRSGRALLYPVYKGTYERGPSSLDVGPNASRDEVISWSKDLSRAIDYLETRADIDRDRIGYYGVSNGGDAGFILTALESRLKASVLQGGGWLVAPTQFQVPPEIHFVNYAPRMRVPTLLVYGRHDFGYPVETFQTPLFRLLGTPAEHKRLASFPGGHTPARWQDVISEILDWFDKYLGPVVP